MKNKKRLGSCEGRIKLKPREPLADFSQTPAFYKKKQENNIRDKKVTRISSSWKASEERNQNLEA